nr:hypothetical protein [Spiroplasma kunkelii]
MYKDENGNIYTEEDLFNEALEECHSESIAAASILAKVTRYNLMLKFDQDYPQYDFKNNKGYGTKKYLLALQEFGGIIIWKH